MRTPSPKICRAGATNGRFAVTEGVTEYTTCTGLLTTSSAAWPKTALFQIIASGVPSSKVVLGKPATAADTVTGYVSPSTLASCVSQAKGKGWSAFNLLVLSVLGQLGHHTDKRAFCCFSRRWWRHELAGELVSRLSD